MAALNSPVIYEEERTKKSAKNQRVCRRGKGDTWKSPNGKKNRKM